MNNKLQIFKSDDFGNVRGLEINGQSWLVGKDVTGILGYSNSSKALKDHVDEEDKLNNKSLSSLGQRGGWLINESGLYSLILRSDMPNAKKFKKWVTSEVLPTIRKTGGYVDDEEEFIKNYFPSFSEEVKQAMVLDLKHQNERIQKELEEKNRFLNQISASSNSILIRDVAHLATKQNIKIGEKRLWNKLREWGLIQKGSTKPMQRALEQGLFEKSEYVIQRSYGVETKFTTRVTGKGQVYIIERLLKECA
ncbi:phage antirepressor [Clostridium perfringens]|uniref:phage antirepressor n=1 Tax=Clostridium perfringens TaxID=1502 RepID=UPI0039E7F153